MNTTRITDAARTATLAALIGAGVAAVVGVLGDAKHVWSYCVYCIGFRLLSIGLPSGALAVSGLPFVMKLTVAVPV
jgi:hypothetical protein